MQISTFFLKRPDGWRPLVPSALSGTENASTVDAVPSAGALLLYPFRTVSIHTFSFPFRSAKDVRNALALKFRPLLSGEQDVEIIPLFAGRSKGGSEGIVMCVWGDEIPAESPSLPLGHNVVWPLPIALASAVNGDGGAVFRNDTVCASVIFRDGLPVFIRCRQSRSDDGGIEGEIRRLVECAEAAGHELAPESVWTGTEERRLFEAARETVRQYPRLLGINISRPALAASLARERTAMLLVKLFGWAAVAGLFFTLIQFTHLQQLRSSMDRFSRESVSLYAEIFGSGERIVDPLSQARGKLAELRGSGRSENTLSMTLSHLGRTWLDGDVQRKDFPVLEQLRYSAEGADITGTAGSMESIQALRTAADTGGFRAALGDIQQIPGGGLRFTLSLRRDAQ